MSIKAKIISSFPASVNRAKKLRFCVRLAFDFIWVALQVFWKQFSAQVLLVIASPNSVGGTELQVIKTAEYLINKGLQVVVLTVGPIKKNSLFLDRLAKGKISCLHLGNLGLTNNAWLQTFISRLLKKMRASYCHLFNPLGAYLIPAAKQAGCHIFYSETGLPCHDPWWAPLNPHLGSIDLTIAISKASLEKFRSTFSFPGPAIISYSLIDPPPPHFVKPVSNKNSFHIVYFGRMYHLKGVFLLLDAFRTLLSKYPHTELSYIGDGPDKHALQKQVKIESLAKQVHFLDFIDKEELYQKLARFDLFCLPSFSEGFPCSILEAMSIGLPVIASSVGGISEIIENGVSGLLIEPNHKDALVEALTQLSDPALRMQIGKNGLKRYRDQFSTEYSLSRLITFYKGVL